MAIGTFWAKKVQDYELPRVDFENKIVVKKGIILCLPLGGRSLKGKRSKNEQGRKEKEEKE